MTSSAKRRTNKVRFLLAVFLMGCVVPGPLKTDYDELGRIVANISPEMAKECAPREYALAQSNQEFAGLELQQGDTRRAREHLDAGLLNARVAFAMANECVPSDSDGDGIPDKEDACPEAAEDFDGVADEDGCPEGTGDTDGDGLSDQDDACMNDPEDKDGFEDEDGCPDPDNDADSIADEDDECPLSPEDIDEFEDENGCPDPDNDGDGIADVDDECPLEAENVNQYFDEDGSNFNPVDFPAVDIESGGDFDNESEAIFAQGTYHLGERWHFTAGIRYTDDNETLDLRARYKFNRNFEVSVEGRNVLDEPRRDFRAVSGNVSQVLSYGPRYNIGVKYRY